MHAQRAVNSGVFVNDFNDSIKMLFFRTDGEHIPEAFLYGFFNDCLSIIIVSVHFKMAVGIDVHDVFITHYPPPTQLLGLSAPSASKAVKDSPLAHRSSLACSLAYSHESLFFHD
jgi:hypothetical protein